MESEDFRVTQMTFCIKPMLGSRGSHPFPEAEKNPQPAVAVVKVIGEKQ